MKYFSKGYNFSGILFNFVMWALFYKPLNYFDNQNIQTGFRFSNFKNKLKSHRVFYYKIKKRYYYLKTI